MTTHLSITYGEMFLSPRIYYKQEKRKEENNIIVKDEDQT